MRTRVRACNVCAAHVCVYVRMMSSRVNMCVWVCDVCTCVCMCAPVHLCARAFVRVHCQCRCARPYIRDCVCLMERCSFDLEKIVFVSSASSGKEKTL